MKHRIVFKEDGKIKQMIVSDNARAADVREDGVYRAKPLRKIFDISERNTPETEIECLVRIAESAGLKDFKIIDQKDIPKDRYFRDAWTDLDDTGVVISREKCEEIQMARIRALRNKKLEELDKEQLKLMSMDQSIDQVKQLKQELRDLPETVSFKRIKKLSTLKNHIPAILQDD